jgi:hypothetical protein
MLLPINSQLSSVRQGRTPRGWSRRTLSKEELSTFNYQVSDLSHLQKPKQA